MSRSLVLPASALLVSMLTLLAHATQTQAGSSPTPEATDPPSAIPAAPADIKLDLLTGTITWTDNSDNETGFTITFEVRQDVASGAIRSEQYNVAANVVSVAISPEARTFTGDLVQVTVVAFNGAGRSAPARLARALDSGPAPSPSPSALTPSVPMGLPETGTTSGGCSGVCQFFWEAIALALLAGSGLVVTGRVHLRGGS